MRILGGARRRRGHQPAGALRGGFTRVNPPGRRCLSGARLRAFLRPVIRLRNRVSSAVEATWPRLSHRGSRKAVVVADRGHERRGSGRGDDPQRRDHRPIPSTGRSRSAHEPGCRLDQCQPGPSFDPERVIVGPSTCRTGRWSAYRITRPLRQLWPDRLLLRGRAEQPSHAC